MGLCDKCGQEVPPENDAVRLEMILNPGDFTLMVAQSRHLLPTDTCEGSPSRAQYLEGQPYDKRLLWRLRPELVKPIREAYRLLQEKYLAA